MQGRRGMDAVRWATSMVVVAALLILPAGAYASAFFRGPVNGGANNAGVEFRARVHHGHTHRVLQFRWFNVPVSSCYDSFGGTHFSMKVTRRGKFHGSYSPANTNTKAIVHGKFKHHAKRAAGTLELTGNFAGGCSNADTGALNWTAKRN